MFFSFINMKRQLVFLLVITTSVRIMVSDLAQVVRKGETLLSMG